MLWSKTFLVFVLRCQDREVLSDMTSRRSDLQIFFVVSKLEPEDRTESSDEDQESAQNATTRSAQEAKVQARKKKRVYERLVKHGYFSAESGQEMDQNERFHGLSAWRIQRYHAMKKKDPNAPAGEFTGYIAAFDRFQNSLKKFAEESLRERVEKVCQVLIRVLSRCLDFFIQKANVLKKGQQLMMKTLDVLLQQEQEVHTNIIRSLDDESTDIKDLLSETFDGARGGILQEAAEFEYALTEYPIPRDGIVSEKAAIGHCKDQLQRMVVNKLQGEIKEKLTMMFRSRDMFVTQMKERIEQIEEEIASGGEIPSAALALGRGLLSSYEAKITFAKRDGVVSRFIKTFATWFYDLLCDPIDTIIKTVKGKVHVGSATWKKEVASAVLKKVDPSKMADELISSLKQHFSTCHDEFVGEINKVQGLFHRGETIKDEQRQKILEFAPNLALLEMLAYGVMDKFKFGSPSQGEVIGTGAQGSVFACDNIKTPEGKPCVVKVVSVAREEVLKDLTLELHNTR